MNDREFELNPYYKKRDLNTKKIAFNQRFTKPIIDDLMQFFKDNDMNQTDGMTYVALEFLNNHCFERKEFYYDVIFVSRKNKDFTSGDLTAIGYVDGYSQLNDFKKIINYDERQRHLESRDDDSYHPYLFATKIKDSSLYFKNTNDFQSDEDGFDYFHKYDEFFHSRQAKNLDDILYILGYDFANLDEKTMLMKHDGTLHGLKIIKLSLNNLLDVKSGGVYKYHIGWKYENFHKGIGILQGDGDDFYFITYTWHIIPSPKGDDVAIDFMDFHSKDEWFEIVMNSTNTDLQDFILDLDDFKDIGKRDLVKDIEDIDKEIQELQKRKKEYQEIIDTLFDDNDSDKKKII